MRQAPLPSAGGGTEALVAAVRWPTALRPRFPRSRHISHQGCSRRLMLIATQPKMAETKPVVDHGKIGRRPVASNPEAFHARSGPPEQTRRQDPRSAASSAAGPLHLLVLKSEDEIGSRPPRAVDCSRGMALPHQLRSSASWTSTPNPLMATGFLSRPTSRSGSREIRFAISTCNWRRKEERGQSHNESS